MKIDLGRVYAYAIALWSLLVVLGYVLAIVYSVPPAIAPNVEKIYKVVLVGIITNLLCFGATHIFRISIGTVTFGLIGLCAILLLILNADNFFWLKALAFFFTCLLMGVSAGRIYYHLFGTALPFYISMLLAGIALHFVLFFAAILYVFNVQIISSAILLMGVHGGYYVIAIRRSIISRGSAFFDSITWPQSIIYLGIFFSLSIAFIAAYAPETYSDAMRSHVPYMANLVREGGLTPNYYLYGHLQPMPFQLLTASGYLFFGQLGAKWITLLVGFLGIVLVIREVLDLTGRRFIAITTGFLLITVPFVWLWLTTNYYDWPMTVFCLAVFSCLRRFLDGDVTYLPLIGVISGFAISIKYSAALFVLPLLLFSFILFRSKFTETLKDQQRYFIYSAIGFLIVIVPWLALVWYWTGNPFFPMFNGVFKSPHLSSDFLREVLNLHHLLFKFPLGFWDLFTWPWSLTFETAKFGETLNGAIGPFFLGIFIPATALVATRLIRLESAGYLTRLVILMTLAATAYLAAVVVLMEGTPYVRFWLPAIALFFISGGVSLAILLQNMPARNLLIRAAFSALLMLFSVSILFGWGVRLNWAAPDGIAWDLYRGAINRDQYLLPQTGGAYKYVNAHLKSGESVFAVRFDHLSEINGFSLQLWPVFDLNLGPNTLTKYIKLVEKLNVRYWIVKNEIFDEDPVISAYHQIGLQQKYWTDNSLVYSSDGYSVFSNKLDAEEKPIRVEKILGQLGGNAWIFTERVDAVEQHQSLPRVCNNTQVFRNLVPPLQATRVSGTVTFNAEKIGANVIVDIIWFDESKEIGRSVSNVITRRTASAISFSRERPSHATRLLIIVRPWREADGCVALGDAHFQWWR